MHFNFLNQKPNGREYILISHLCIVRICFWKNPGELGGEPRNFQDAEAEGILLCLTSDAVFRPNDVTVTLFVMMMHSWIRDV